MDEQSDFELFKLQQESLKQLQKEQPELFEVGEIFEEEKILPEIGILNLSKDRLKGFIRLYPHDFIVEEIQDDGSISQVEPMDVRIDEPKTEKFTLFADLVKVGISTLDALNRLAKQLKISVDKIGTAGIKDASAMTSQRVALPGIKREGLKDIKFEGFFLTNFKYGRGTVEKGAIKGNRFSIFVRTEKELNNKWIEERINYIQRNGFLNYYNIQRFGGQRLLSHKLGRLILQGHYAEAIKKALVEQNKFNIRLVKLLREKAKTVYGNWQEMKKIYSLLPYAFRQEIKILNYLIEKPNNYIGALIHLQDQTTLWVYAYGSWLFNKYLSEHADNPKHLLSEVPLILSPDENDNEIYQKWLNEDRISDIRVALKPFKFIQFKKRAVKTIIVPEIIETAIVPEGVIICFFLPKGVYATTFLMNLFKLQQGLPLPRWLKTTEYDIKKLLGTGTIEPAKEILKDYIFSVLDYGEDLKDVEINPS